MQFKISVNKLMTSIGICLFLFFTLTTDFRLSIFGNVFIAYVFALFAIGLLLFFSKRKTSARYLKLPVAFWILSICFVATAFELNYIVRYSIGLILLLCYAETLGAGNTTIKVLGGFGIIFAIFSFVFWLLPNVYINQVVPLLAEYERIDAVTMIRSNRFPGLTGHYSTNGIYLSMGFGAITGIILSNIKNKKKNVVAYVWLLLITGALLLIGKRAHLFFSIAAAFAVYWLCYSGNKATRFLKVMRITVIGMVLLVIALEQIPMLSNTFDRFTNTIKEGQFWMSRDILFAQAWIAFLRHPLLGNGWRSLMDGIMGLDAHNVFVQLLAETGIVGFAFFFSLIVYGVVTATKTLGWFGKHKEYTVQDTALLYFAVYYVYFFSLYCLTGNPLYDEQPFYIYMISYGSVLYYNSQIRIIKAKMSS